MKEPSDVYQNPKISSLDFQLTQYAQLICYTCVIGSDEDIWCF